MSANQILRDSASVHCAIKDVLADAEHRRVVVVAFVGDAAENFLPGDLKGLRLICWPRAGGTDPRALRALGRRGAQVEFVDGLHMKLYWSARRGSVISSANLSQSALGARGLREIGVLVPSVAVEIDRILKDLRPRRPTKQDWVKLDKEHVAYGKATGYGKSSERVYCDWYAERPLSAWKWWSWENLTGRWSKAAREAVRETIGNAADPATGFLADGRSARAFHEHDWILQFKRRGDGSVGGVDWMSVDRVIKVPPSDKSHDASYPFEVIQIRPLKRYPTPPFKLDTRFLHSFRRLLRRKRPEDGSTAPTGKFLMQLFEACASGRRS